MVSLRYRPNSRGVDYALRERTTLPDHGTPPRPTASRPEAKLAQGQGARWPELPEAQADDAVSRPAYRLRRGALSERRRVLGARRRDVHDPWRRLHQKLRLLRRGSWSTASVRPGRTGTRGRGRRDD